MLRHPEVPRIHQRDEGSRVHWHRADVDSSVKLYCAKMLRAGSLARLNTGSARDDAIVWAQARQPQDNAAQRRDQNSITAISLQVVAISCTPGVLNLLLIPDIKRPGEKLCHSDQ